MNDFEFTQDNGIHIPHLSPSTINSFISSRFNFHQSKVKSKPFSGNQYTARGSAIEHGVNTWIENPDHPDILSEVYKKYDEEIAKGNTGRLEAMEIRESLQGLAELSLDFYKPEFTKTPALTQTKVSANIDEIERDIIGYLDYLQPKVRIRDSKVVSRTPSVLSQAYILQGSFYRKATGLNVVFDFFVANKTPVHKAIVLTDEDYVFGLSYLTAAAKVIEEMQVCTSPARMMELMSFPDLESFYNAGERNDACKVWGIAIK